jgi:PEGA domain
MLTLAATTVVPRAAWAGPTKKELSRARAQFQKATELEQAGQYAAALDAFREVGQVKMTPQVRYHIAFCEEKLGHLSTALGGYELAASEAQEVGPGFEKEVEQHISDLKARIPKLLITRGKGAEAAKIEVDGVEIGESSIGVETPVDPGPHSVTAKAPDHRPFSATVEIAESETKPVEVTLGANESEGPVTNAGSTPTTDHGVTGEARGPSKVPPLLLVGLGGASLVASGVFYLLRQGKLSELDDACKNGACPADKKDTYDQAKTYTTVSMVTAGVGVAAVGVGVTWLLLQPKKKSAWQLAPAAPDSYAGLSVLGQF